MIPKNFNLTSPQTLLSTCQSQESTNTDSTIKPKNHVSKKKGNQQKKTAKDYKVELLDEQKVVKERTTVKSEKFDSPSTLPLNDTASSKPEPLRHSQRKRKPKLHFDEKHPPVELKKPKQERYQLPSQPSNESIPESALSEEELPIVTAPEYNEEKETLVSSIQSATPLRELIERTLPDQEFPKQRLRDFKTLSMDEEFTHDVRKLDFTDFIEFDQVSPTIHGFSDECEFATSSGSNFFDFKAFTKTKEKYLRDIKSLLASPPKKPTNKQGQKKSLEKITLSLKSIQVKLFRFPEDKKVRLEVIYISELITRLRNATYFPHEKRYIDGLNEIVVLEKYRSLKKEFLIEARNLAKHVKDKLGVWSESAERERFEKLDRRMSNLDEVLKETQKFHPWQDEKNALTQTGKALTSLSAALKTNAHEEIYKKLEKQLSLLEQDGDRYRARLTSTAS